MWERKKEGLGFIKTSLQTAINHFMENCYFNVRNVTMTLSIGITIGIHPAPIWADLFLYYYKEGYISSLQSRRGTSTLQKTSLMIFTL